jgi:hypothetical protein
MMNEFSMTLPKPTADSTVENRGSVSPGMGGGNHLFDVKAIGVASTQFLRGEISREEFVGAVKAALAAYSGGPAGDADVSAALKQMSDEVLSALPGAATNLFRSTLEKFSATASF